MDSEHLFLYTYADLKERLGRGHPLYVYLRAAGLLRQLLGDGGGLLDLANARKRLKLRFAILDYPGREQPEGSFLISDPHMGVDRDAVSSPLLDVTRDKFLATPLYRSGGETVTVIQVVNHVANEMGGIHSGRRKSADRAELFNAIDHSLAFARVQKAGLAAFIEQISRCVVWSLEPLYLALVDDHGDPTELAPLADWAEQHPGVSYMLRVREIVEPK